MSQSLPTVLRKLGRRPGFTAVAVLTLALAIGANAAIFSVVHGVLIQPLPYPQADRLVSVSHTAPGLDMEDLSNSQALFMTYRELARSLEEIGLMNTDTLNLTGLERPERVRGAQVTPSLFPTLRVAPVLGPGMTDDDGLPEAEPVVLISHALWRTRLGGDPEIIGRTLRVDGVERRVVGVMPEGFDYPEPETALWVPLVFDPTHPNDGNFNWRAVARLAPGTEDLSTVRAELTALLPRMVELYSEDLSLELLDSAGLAPVVRPFKEEVVGDVDRVLWILLGTVGLILLIACANVANLFLVRAEGRQREMAVRSALGAGRGEVARQFLTESMVLGLLGGAAGLGLALLGVRALGTLAPQSIPRLHEVGIDPPVLAFTLAVSLLAGLLFGTVPLLRFRRSFSLTGALKEGGRGSTSGRERHFARNALVVTQVALALVLLVGSGLMLRSFAELRGVEPGFEPKGLLTLRVAVDETDYPDGQRVAEFFERLRERLEALPGVERAAGGSGFPLQGDTSMSAHSFEGQPVPEGTVPPVLANIRVTPGYFETLGVPLLAGRTHEPADHRRQTGALVVTRALAERFWPGEPALGKRLQNGVQSAAEQEDRWEENWYTVVGVVDDFRYFGLDQEVPEMIFYVNGPPKVEGRNWFARTLTVIVRTAPGVDPLSLAAPVRQAVWDLDPNLPISDLRTGRAILEESTARTAFTMIMLLLAAVVALVLGAVGLYGVISYIVSLRTQEIGVRMALGAGAGDVARMVVTQGVAVAAVGVALGLAGAFALTRLMSALLFGVSATDPVTFASVSAGLLAVAAAASWLPARRAAATDPLEALRHE